MMTTVAVKHNVLNDESNGNSSNDMTNKNLIEKAHELYNTTTNTVLDEKQVPSNQKGDDNDTTDCEQFPVIEEITTKVNNMEHSDVGTESDECPTTADSSDSRVSNNVDDDENVPSVVDSTIDEIIKSELEIPHDVVTASEECPSADAVGSLIITSKDVNDNKNVPSVVDLSITTDENIKSESEIPHAILSTVDDAETKDSLDQLIVVPTSDIDLIVQTSSATVSSPDPIHTEVTVVTTASTEEEEEQQQQQGVSNDLEKIQQDQSQQDEENCSDVVHVADNVKESTQTECSSPVMVIDEQEHLENACIESIIVNSSSANENVEEISQGEEMNGNHVDNGPIDPDDDLVPSVPVASTIQLENNGCVKDDVVDKKAVTGSTKRVVVHPPVVPSFQKIPKKDIVQGCINQIMAAMRADQKYTNPSRFTEEDYSTNSSSQLLHPLYVQLQELSKNLGETTAVRGGVQQIQHNNQSETMVGSDDSSEEVVDGDDSESNAASDEEDFDDENESDDDDEDDNYDDDSDDDDDNVPSDYAIYLKLFCDAVKRSDVGAAITGAVLTSIHKLIVYDIIAVGTGNEGGVAETKKNSSSKLGLRLIADCLIRCTFEEAAAVPGVQQPVETTTLVTTTKKNPVNGPTTPNTAYAAGTGRDAVDLNQLNPPQPNPSIPTFAVSNTDAEQSVMKLLGVIVTTVDYSTRNGHLLTPSVVTGLLTTCLHVSHRAASATALLRSAASTSASQIIVNIFSCTPTACDSDNDKNQVDSFRLSIFRKLFDMLKVVDACVPFSTVTAEVFGLMKVALESTDGEIPSRAEKEFLRQELFKFVMATSIETRDSIVLEGAINIIFNIWITMKHDMKGEFEVFLQSLHFRILDNSRQEMTTQGRWRRAASTVSSAMFSSEAKEIVLSNMIDICRHEPTTLRDSYMNYDCDVACSDVYKTMLTALCKSTIPPLTPLSKVVPAQRDEKNGTVPPMLSDKVSNTTTDTNSVDTQSTSGEAIVPSRTNSFDGDNAPMSRTTPLNHLNHLALEGMLAALYSITYESADACGGNEKDQIYEVLKSGFVESVSEDVVKSRKERKVSLEKVAFCFNTNPDKDDWLRLSVSEGLLSESFPLDSFQAAKIVARILHSAGNLDKTKLGAYLSKGPEKRYPFELMVRKEFASLYDFAEMSFPVALRAFLSKFRMPGEAQCIDRIMEVFSREFYEQQGKTMVFKNSDAVYVLAFSTIMLNTDLHNRTIKAGEKMTQDQFVRNNRGINGGDNLDEGFVRDLYDQIKAREIQVRREVGEYKQTNEKENFRNTWDELLTKKREMELSLFTSKTQQYCLIADKEMFEMIAPEFVQTLMGMFVRTKSDGIVVKCLRALQHIVKVAEVFELFDTIKEIVLVLLVQGKEYISSCLALDYSSQDDGALVANSVAKPSLNNGNVEDEGSVIDPGQPIPYGLLCSNTSQSTARITGSAAHKGLLALDSGLSIFRKYSHLIADGWPIFIECLCSLRDAHALPEGLSELDDFADSNGNVLPLSFFALSSKRALDEYYRAWAEKDTTKNKGWFRSIFRGNKGPENEDLNDIRALKQNAREISIYSKALLTVAEAADVEDSVQMGSMKLPNATVQSLLSNVAQYPFVNDPVGEQQAVFSLELATRSLLSDRENAIELFTQFLITFENILCRLSNDEILSPFVIERIVVTILRCSIHLYDSPHLRPTLRSSLQLLTTTLPKTFVRTIADRMACGIAIILRASFHFFESSNEWCFMGDTLDMLANYSTSREFVFDGIASTVEYAVPSSKEVNTIEEDRPKLSLDACEALSRILIRFTLGFYKGDLSLTVPAMLCLEKMYRFKVEHLLLSHLPQDSDICALAPDKEFWQNVTVAVYAVCRSADPESSGHGLECFRRIIMRTKIDEIPDEKWIAILYLMVNKQPPLVASVSRGNTFTLLGHMLARVLPHLSHQTCQKEDLVELINQVAALMNENLHHCRNGSSPLFEKTLQTATYLSNHMSSDEWTGEISFSSWACEVLMKELEVAGASMVAYQKRNSMDDSETTNNDEHKELGDESEVSELSVTECNDDID